MHRPTLCVAAVCLLAVAAAPLRAQGFNGVIQFLSYKDAGEAPDTLTQITKGSKLRMEGMGGGGAMIMDGKTRMILMPEQKKYVTMPIDVGEHESENGDRKGTAVRTGKMETVAGIPCEVWHYTETNSEDGPESGDVCLAKGAGFMAASFGGGDVGEYLSEGGPAFTQALASGMGIMKVTNNGQVQLVAIKAQRTLVPDAMFAPPAGYTSLDMTHMGGMRKKP